MIASGIKALTTPLQLPSCFYSDGGGGEGMLSDPICDESLAAPCSFHSPFSHLFCICRRAANLALAWASLLEVVGETWREKNSAGMILHWPVGV